MNDYTHLEVGPLQPLLLLGITRGHTDREALSASNTREDQPSPISVKAASVYHSLSARLAPQHPGPAPFRSTSHAFIRAGPAGRRALTRLAQRQQSNTARRAPGGVPACAKVTCSPRPSLFKCPPSLPPSQPRRARSHLHINVFRDELDARTDQEKYIK